MRLVMLLATGFAAFIAVCVWRSRHGVEVWHAAADAPSRPNQGP
jgi:hypothetical protein